MNVSQIIIRNIQQPDVINRHHFFLELAKAGVGMINTPEEIGEIPYDTKEQIDYFIQNNFFWLVATYQDRIIGEIDITPYQAAKIKHVGKLTIGILPDFQSQGLGSMLMKKALEYSKLNKLRRIELFVFASNIKAINLYKKFGFVIEGERKNFIKVSSNTYESDLLMAKYL